MRQVTVCNDADAATLAEHWVGSAKDGLGSVVMISTSSGHSL